MPFQRKRLNMCSHINMLVSFLPNVTLTIDDKLHKRMAKHKEIRWSNVARQAFESRVEELELVDKLLEKSELTEEDAEEIGHKIKAEVRKRFEKRFGKWS